MKIWLVLICDCESTRVEKACLTKKIAIRELFKTRDELIKEWKKMHIIINKTNKKICKDYKLIYEINNMYKNMIKKLSNNDYKQWDNSPHECPSIHCINIIDK